MSALLADRPVRTSATGPVLRVHLDAVADNTRLLAARSTGALMAVVKADGFGHGAADVARTALRNGASWLGVATLDEAAALRAAGLTAPVLSWLNPVDADWAGAASACLDVALPGVEHLHAAVAALGARRSSGAPPLRAHLHADVGLARDGAAPAQWRSFLLAARRAEAVGGIRVVGLMGHLALAESGPDDRGRAAFARFVRLAVRAGLRPEVRHLATTAATLTDPRAHHSLCRVGAGLVGIDPSGSTVLRGAATLTAPVVSVRDVGAGTGVGYGHAAVTRGRTRLALLPLGYGDGLPRAAVGAEVLLGGRRCPLIGRTSMDQAVVDVGELPVAVGDRAVVFGPGGGGEPTIGEWAGWARTIPHEIVTGLGPRIARELA